MFREPVILTLKNGKQVGTGCVPDIPDLRDYNDVRASAKIRGVNILKWTQLASDLPTSVDLRDMCSPIEDQGTLGSCAAQAGIGLVEYMERRSTGGEKHVNGSARYVYHMAKNALLGWSGDAGSTMRSVMATVALFGVPPEKWWPYSVDKDAYSPNYFDMEPDAHVHALAGNFRGLVYFRYDHRHVDGEQLVLNMKQYLAAGIPQIFGFFGFSSANSGDSPGAIPYPCPGEAAQWGHGVMTCGYDDEKVIVNQGCLGPGVTDGAFLFRNSWGTDWGEEGYGWLPYRYFVDGWAWDIWSWVIQRWIDTGRFGI